MTNPKKKNRLRVVSVYKHDSNEFLAGYRAAWPRQRDSYPLKQLPIGNTVFSFSASKTPAALTETPKNRPAATSGFDRVDQSRRPRKRECGST